jgi:hypothetical protein
VTAAETLRAAAAKLRETASKATAGPWTAQEVPDEVYVEIMAGTEVAVAHAVCEHPAAPGTAADAEWIALMSPDKAEPIAVLLEAAARSREAAERSAAFVSDESCTITPEQIDTPATPCALAVARAVLGDAS